MPPALYIHMPRDTNMASKVKSNMDALKAANVAVAQIRVRARDRLQRGGWNGLEGRQREAWNARDLCDRGKVA